jgi:hypothetical protein
MGWSLTPSRSCPPWKRTQAGSLTQLYGKSCCPPSVRTLGLGGIETPKSARAPKTWWDAPDAAVAPSQVQQQDSDRLGATAKQPRYTYQVGAPAMAYQASVLEERMLLAVSLTSWNRRSLGFLMTRRLAR